MKWLSCMQALALLVSCGEAALAEAAEVALCPHIKIMSAERLTFEPLEKRLACGDPHNKPWANVPRNQATFALRTFLQARGYYRPTFTTGDGGSLVADAGEPTLVTKIDAVGAPAELELSHYWKPFDQPLTPKVLTDLEGWVKDELKASGYACPVVKTRADPDSGAITVHITSGVRGTVSKIDADEVPGVWPGVIRRSDAFKLGDVYNAHLLTLTTRRLQGEELLLSTRFVTTCAKDQVYLQQEATPGPPRAASAGFGFNTERLFLVRGSLRSSRLGPAASQFDLTAAASRPEQEVVLKGDWYVLPYPSRLFLRPSLSFQREFENDFETRSSKIRLAPAAATDGDGFHVSGSLGPAFELVRTLRMRGEAPNFTHILALDGEGEVMTHGFEYYQATPREGFRASANARITSKSWQSDVEARRLVLNGESLWNVAAKEPEILVVGLRGGVATTLTGRAAGDREALPPTYRHYLGGAASVRGFPRGSLPAGGSGALTAAYSGLELRLANQIPFGVQPLVFADVGATGIEPMHVEKPLYWSPGLGCRWQSPVGPIRGTAARGFLRGAQGEQPPKRWNFFLSLGEEF